MSVYFIYCRCSVDPVILAELKYDPTLTKATAETFGFKFSDTSSLQFFCSVEVCQKKSLDCAGMTVRLNSVK